MYVLLHHTRRWKISLSLLGDVKIDLWVQLLKPELLTPIEPF